MDGHLLWRGPGRCDVESGHGQLGLDRDWAQHVEFPADEMDGEQDLLIARPLRKSFATASDLHCQPQFFSGHQCFVRFFESTHCLSGQIFASSNSASGGGQCPCGHRFCQTRQSPRQHQGGECLAPLV